MPATTIYHNPRCSKSRQALQLLRDRGLEPTVVDYLQTPPDIDTLRGILKKLDMSPADLLRRGETEFTELALRNYLDDDEYILKALTRYPILIERPIVVHGDKARLGRPPQRVLEIL